MRCLAGVVESAAACPHPWPGMLPHQTRYPVMILDTEAFQSRPVASATVAAHKMIYNYHAFASARRLSVRLAPA